MSGWPDDVLSARKSSAPPQAVAEKAITLPAERSIPPEMITTPAPRA